MKKYLLLAIGLTLLVISAGMALATDADAAQPYGGCAEAGRYPSSPGASDCREAGWTVRPGLVVSPRGVLRYYDLPSCRYEDGSGQRRACGWNVTTGDGNGHGTVYIAITRRDGGERYISLHKCNDNGCHYWRR